MRTATLQKLKMWSINHLVNLYFGISYTETTVLINTELNYQQQEQDF